MISVQRSLRCRAFNWDRRLGLGLASVLKRVRSDAVMQNSNKGTPHVLAPEVVRRLENTYAGPCRRETPATEESHHSAPKTITINTQKERTDVSDSKHFNTIVAC